MDVVPLDEHLENDSPMPSASSTSNVDRDQAHIILADGLTITASSRPSPNPPVLITTHREGVTATYQLHSSCGSSSTTLSHVTALSVDQGRTQTSPSEDRVLRVVAFYSNSTFAIFSIPVANPSSFTEFATLRRPRTAATISHAAYHHPLLVGLSDDFTLSIYGVRERDGERGPSAACLQTLKSFTSFPPSSMVLSSRPSSPSQPGHLTYKLVLSYAVPIYPSHWSLGVSDLTILRRGPDCIVEHARSVKASSSRLPPSPAVPGSASSPSPRKRNARRVSAPVAPVVEDELAPIGYAEADNEELQRARELMALEREQWARKVARVVATETDGRWVVLAGEQDGAALQVYRLSSRAARLVFVRNLFGHRSVVTALAVADGRCVSLGKTGEVWAWDLESGTGVEVDGPPDNEHGCRGLLHDSAALQPMPTIAFDERRILSRSGNAVQIRRFDL